MLSHRGHTETLRLQGEANRLQTEADILHTRASDQWGFYQAKNIRAHEYRALGQMLGQASAEVHQSYAPHTVLLTRLLAQTTVRALDVSRRLWLLITEPLDTSVATAEAQLGNAPASPTPNSRFRS